MKHRYRKTDFLYIDHLTQKKMQVSLDKTEQIKKSEPRRIYIRHSNKEYVNGDALMFKHDPGITEKGVENAKMVAQHLIEQWGIPSKIIVSPYRRARETAKVMRSVLTNTDNTEKKKKIPIYVDREVSEYLGNHRSVTIDVTESTLVHDPPHPETFNDMKLRVKKHHDKITNYMKKDIKKGSSNNTNNKNVIWIITHGLIMKQVASLIGIKMSKEFPPLTCLSIMDGEIITKGEVIMFHESLDISESRENSEITENIETTETYE